MTSIIFKRAHSITERNLSLYMIRESIKIHDKHQLEIKIGYQRQADEEETNFEIESYFFMPSNLGINKDTYSREDFYNDMQVYIRFKTPSYLLEELAKDESLTYSSLKDAMKEMVETRSKENCLQYEEQLKMFCCIFKATLRDHIDYLFTRTNKQDKVLLINKLVNETHRIASSFRSLRSIVAIPNLSEKMYSMYLFADEYISLLIEQFSLKGIRILRHNKENNDLIKQLKDLIINEVSYRTDNNYSSIIQNDANNELFLYRSSVLKKYMGSILFLNVRTQSQVNLIEHLLYACAAGISMVVATGIAFYCQKQLGNLTFPFFIALVVSYMFKDRIKVIFQQFFSNQIKKRFYDQKKKIFYTPSKTIGICKESVDYYKTENVPEHILKIRNCDHMTEIENGWVGQTIIRYKRTVKLFWPQIRKTFKRVPVKTVNDILRFNVTKFLAKMDDPNKTLYYLSQGEIKKTSAERAYHINLILKFSVRNRKTIYKRFRIILNRKGINRLEEVPVDFMNAIHLTNIDNKDKKNLSVLR